MMNSILLQGGAQNAGTMQVVLLLIIIGIGLLITLKANKTEDLPTSSDQTNKVINVTLIGGLIGLFSSSPQSRLNDRIKKENTNGWRVIQIIPSDSGNIFLFIFRFILLVFTIFLFTTVNGYYVVLEKK